MYAVGKLGSYISRGVYTVSGPFHPFGGAVDIVVVEQPDGTFKSSPWYVRFGKFQGVLKASEKVVSINVDGIDADFNMFLDHKGEAFFLREVEAEEGELEHYATSGDETDVNAELWKVRKCKSYNFDANRSDLVSELESSNGKVLPKNNSRRGRLFGLSFGRGSIRENNGFQGGEGGPVVDRATSMERAELAADLLEVRWTTNLKTGQAKLPPSKADFEVVSKVKAEEGLNKIGNFVSGDDTDKVYSSVSGGDAEIPTSTNPLNYVGMLSMEETYMKVDLSSDASHHDITNDGDNARSALSEVSNSDAMLSQKENNYETEGCVLYSDEHSDGGENTLCSTVDGPLACEFGTSALCNPHEPLVEDVSVKSKVDEEVCSSIGSINELCSEDLCTHNSDPISLPPVSDSKTSSAEVQKVSLTLNAEECSGDSAFKRNSSLSLLNDSEEEQFSFSDLDDQKVDKDGCKKRRPQDSSESSEDEVSETDFSDDKSHQVICKLILGDNDQQRPNENSNRMSSPISISKQDKYTDEQALTLVAEAMPNMLIDVDGVGAYGGPERLGHSLDSNLEAIKMVNDVLVASEGNTAKQQIESVQLETNSSKISDDIKKIISDPAVEISLCRYLLSEGMGYEAAAVAFDAEKMDADEFCSLGPEIVKNDKLVVRIGGLYFPWDAALPIASAIGSQEMEKLLEPTGMIAVGQTDDKTSEEVTQKAENSGSGTWKIWPFLFKRSNSMQGKGVDSERASESPSVKVDNMDAARPKPSKRKVRSKAPTSEQLASLKLKDGKNEVTFTFSTAMLGKQQVDARIFLWKWNSRIVISDVDGTITKSDVLGQFMPLMGMDWSQMGVTHLFSAIKENGYQLLFLSARSISQAYTTRQFLCNLKQDGKELPEGPVIISPDGLFPSLYREVIRRAPHEFKISCLEDIKVLFPPDHSPFYAGFGNRDTDEISYLRVGIPIGKIFIINPKGQIAVNRRVDTKSYTSLHSLVHGMFPPAPVAEQEDYNSWNFWRLPPPDVV